MNFSFVNILLIGIAIAFFGFMAYWFYMSMTMTMEDVSAKSQNAGNPSQENQPKKKADKSNKK